MQHQFDLKAAPRLNKRRSQTDYSHFVDGSAENCYVGYFENPHGEQWIFTMDRQTGEATLRGGDVGWNTKFDVTNGSVADLILEREEQLWLEACLSSAQKQVVRG